MSGMTREERLWQKLVDEAGEELIEEAAAVSVAQAEKDLAAWGFDVAAERARAEAFLVSLETAVAEEGVAPPPSTPSTGPAAPSTEVAAAAELRHRAAAACEKGHADECLSLLDQAAASDPDGDTTPEVQRLRKKAAATQAKPK